ncbi:hypothetical protein [Maridesulfovibrio sp.]|uniref:hypothetical protein n=1 Tax=Maridesulfovibrio sp. TaxID=2795000 RepID=UPI003BA9DBF2
MRKFYCPFIFVLSVLVLFPLCANAASYTGNGMGVIIEGDRASALNLATKSAYKKAVSKAMESKIPIGSSGRMAYGRKKPLLFKGPLPFVKGQRMVSQQVEGKVLRVTLAVDVDENKLQRFLGQQGFLAEQAKQAKKMSLPTVMVLVVEEMNGAQNPFPFVSSQITSKLMEDGYDVLDQTLVQKAAAHDQAVQGVLRGNPRAAQAVALQYGAGLLITGRAIGSASGMKAGGMQAYGADVVLQALQADTGRILATGQGSGSYPHINAVTGQRKAIGEAAGKAFKRLMKGMDKRMASTEETMTVTVSNVNYKQLTVLKKIMGKKFKSISKLRQRSFAGNVAKLDVTLAGAPEAFVDEVALAKFGKFRLEVLSVSPQKADFVLKK